MLSSGFTFCAGCYILCCLFREKVDSCQCVIISGGRSSGWSHTPSAGGAGVWVWGWDGGSLPAQKEEGEEAK